MTLLLTKKEAARQAKILQIVTVSFAAPLLLFTWHCGVILSEAKDLFSPGTVVSS
jgi:hypothetical protein